MIKRVMAIWLEIGSKKQYSCSFFIDKYFYLLCYFVIIHLSKITEKTGNK